LTVILTAELEMESDVERAVESVAEFAVGLAPERGDALATEVCFE
jgi:hypothetical protein